MLFLFSYFCFLFFFHFYIYFVHNVLHRREQIYLYIFDKNIIKWSSPAVRMNERYELFFHLWCIIPNLISLKLFYYNYRGEFVSCVWRDERECIRLPKDIFCHVLISFCRKDKYRWCNFWSEKSICIHFNTQSIE